MEASLVVNDSQGKAREFRLEGTAITLGGGPDDSVPLGAGHPPSVLVLNTRAANRGGWTVTQANPAAYATLNGERLTPGVAVPLAPGASMVVNGVSLRFDERPAPPRAGGVEVRTIPLPRSGELVFGRQNEGDAPSAGRVDLDPGDLGISARHAVVRAEGRRFLVEDVSRLGTMLNGDGFATAELVYGDRLRIGHYIFEFDGGNLRWLEDSETGALLARSLSRSAGGRRILDDVSLQVRPGEFVGILGGSGQGKSTLLNALCGLIPASSGEVFISGQPLKDKAGMRKLGIGYVPQDDIVHKELKVKDALLIGGRLRINLPLPQIRARVARVIRQLGLEEHQEKRIHMLSGGQRKRVSIGIELLSNPSVLFLDEPSSGLDPATEERLMVLLQSLALSGITVICTTHVLHNAFLFNRLLFIHGGRLVFAGNSDEARMFFLGDPSMRTSDQLEAPLEKIYAVLADEAVSAEAREKAFHASPYFQRVPPAGGERRVSLPPPSAARKVRSWKVLHLLMLRQWKILIADPLNIAFLLAQAVIISFLISWASDDIGMRMFIAVIAAMWFGCSNAAQQIISEILVVRRERVCGLGLNTYYFSKLVFLSLLTAVQTFLLFGCTTFMGNWFHPKEFDRQLFAERVAARCTAVAGVEEPSEGFEDFMAEGDEEAPATKAPAKAAAHAATAAPKPPSATRVKQLAWLASTFHIGPNLTESGPKDLLLDNGDRARGKDGKLLTFPGIPLGKVITSTIGLRFLGLLAAGMLGVTLGLAVSAVVRSPTQSVMWVPLILIPQILFGGFVIPFPEMGKAARAFCQVAPSFAAERILEVSNIFGSSTPFLANRTKTPVFLTSDGKKETVAWQVSGHEVTQDYDEISSFNRAWQNLLVSPSRRGEHKQEENTVAGTFTTVPRDSVKNREDVLYRKGTVFSTLAPAGSALLTLTVWAALCYILTVAGLLSKERVR